MKRIVVIAIIFVTFVGMIAAPRVKKTRTSGAKTAPSAALIVGHTYTKHRARVSDPELACAYDNGKFRLIFDVSVYFVTESDMEIQVAVNLESDYYSQTELSQVINAIRNEIEKEYTESYTVRNGYIYVSGQKTPVAVIEPGGKSITFKDWTPFDGNTLVLDD